MRTRIVIFTTVAIMAAVLIFLAFHSPDEKPLATADVGDGRILQVEGVTYGTNHIIGNHFSQVLNRFHLWVPSKLYSWLMPKRPESHIVNKTPCLVVWVNAIDPVTGTNVDCQKIRVEIVGENGDLFESQPYWFGMSGKTYFSRVGRVFRVYPREQEKFTIQVVPWKNLKTNRFELANPYIVKAEAWTGEPLPQRIEVDGNEIILSGLQKLTNGSSIPAKYKYATTPSVYWQPVFELRRNGEVLNDWDAPEWTAEDPLGNKGQHLGVHQPVMRFSATFYPSSTNTAAQSLAALPQFSSTNRQSIQWWQQKIPVGTNEIVALGLFPPGCYSFSDGNLLTNSTSGALRGVMGGAPTGWTSMMRPASPLKTKIQTTYTHYSNTNSIIYLRVPETSGNEKLALRLRDEHGKLWPAELEKQGTRDGIFPFILNIPPDAGNVTPEVIVLKPIDAQFTVKMPVEAN